MLNRKYDSIQTLQSAGFSYEDACALRRISMTLHRWHELECGNSNNYGSWAIVRGRNVKTIPDHIPTLKTSRTEFVHDDAGAPFLEHHHYRHGAGKDTVSYTLIADRERGALKRLAAIMARYPGSASYVQSDPRGCSLYILRPGDVPKTDPNCAYSDHDISSYYSRGIAVHK